MLENAKMSSTDATDNDGLTVDSKDHVAKRKRRKSNKEDLIADDEQL